MFKTHFLKEETFCFQNFRNVLMSYFILNLILVYYGQFSIAMLLCIQANFEFCKTVP